MKAERLSNGESRFAAEVVTEDGGTRTTGEWVFGPPPKSFRGDVDAWYEACKREALLLAALTPPVVTSSEDI